ncbi:hypothetical protein BWQ96_04006 [Gracilariopsis chorda]|uniref:Uncharacterized protein n=1 Tax=Gracilariopsis chorda TaxID=448386 RepID=A0A2V3IVS7_9FLOR|nr:hypothetical protein BWQ96_04006 [Gracilariopsis chorda]|eukprot:PXF46221.1 hypothetical protein BWQ96_04006 [Gracilariopsis chorda]
MDGNDSIDREKILAALVPLVESEVPELSETQPDTTASSEPVLREIRPRQILGPVPKPNILSAVHTWLSHRNLSLEDLQTGIGLCRILELEDNPPEGFRAGYNLFREGAVFMNISPENVPSLLDIRLQRNWPKLLCCVAHVASHKDQEEWDACLEAAGATHPSNWRDVMRNERWQGDEIARQIATLAGSHCTFIVAGTQGSGKSATLQTLLSRTLLPPSNPFTFHDPHERMSESEQLEADKRRHLAAVNWPNFPISDNMPFGSMKTDFAHVKVDDAVLSFVELPEMGVAFDEVNNNEDVVYLEHGTFEEVMQDVQGENAHVVLLVERLDEFCETSFRSHVRKVRRLFGNEMFYRMIVILTHAHSHPTGELSYEIWVFDQIRRVRESLRKVWKRGPKVPVVLFENSERCPLINGRRRLRDGTDFVDQFLSCLEQALKEGEEDFQLVPTPSKKWWEQYVVIGIAALLLSRLQ